MSTHATQTVAQLSRLACPVEMKKVFSALIYSLTVVSFPSVAKNLNDTDMRRSVFIDCDFGLAKMKGAVLTRQQGAMIHLSNVQITDVDWRDESGPEPDGG
jgi:hypothetical protein